MSKDLTDALDALTKSGNDGLTSIPAPKPRGKKDKIISSGIDVVTKNNGNSGGISSPLIENTGTREYYENNSVYTSSDGMITFEVNKIKKTVFTDSSGAQVVFEWSIS